MQLHYNTLSSQAALLVDDSVEDEREKEEGNEDATRGRVRPHSADLVPGEKMIPPRMTGA